ncbi:hypothetical protein pb186bvf_008003 [Paramecium bursaria]
MLINNIIWIQYQQIKLLVKLKNMMTSNQLPRLCMSSSCDSPSRYLCQECLIEGLHYHNGLKPLILSQEQILVQFQQRLTLLKSNYQEKLKSFQQQYQEALKMIKEIENIMKNLQIYQFQEGIEIADSDKNYFESLRKLITQSFFTLSPDNISKIINITEYQLDSSKLEQFRKNFDNLISKFESLKIQINNLQSYGSLYSSQTNIDEQIRKIIYTEEIIDLRYYLRVALIKQIQNFLQQSQVVKMKNFIKLQDGEICFIIVINIILILLIFKHKKTFKLTYRNSQIDFLQFSDDSQFLYYKENNESFYCLHLKDEKFQDFRHFPELMSILFFLATKWNRAFIINKNKKIQLLDTEHQYTLFEEQTQIQISYAGDVLEFWDEDTGLKVHESSQQQKLQQLQLKMIKGESTLLGCEQEHFFIFQIQYNQKLIKIIELQKFKYEQKILSYSQVWNTQYLVIFGEFGSAKIYDKDFKTIKHIFIGSEDDQKNKQFDIAQCSNNLSAIIVISNTKSKCLYLASEN